MFSSANIILVEEKKFDYIFSRCRDIISRSNKTVNHTLHCLRKELEKVRFTIIPWITDVPTFAQHTCHEVSK